VRGPAMAQGEPAGASSVMPAASAVSAAHTRRVVRLDPLGDALANRGAVAIVRGKEADPRLYPASFQANTEAGVCTWFLVSAHVLLGAAHCVFFAGADDGEADVDLRMADGLHHGECKVPAEFLITRSPDIVACHLPMATPVPGALVGPVAGFEVINTSQKLLKKSTRIEISGFGCTISGGSVVDTYQIGNATVQSIPPNAFVPGATQATPDAIELSSEPSLLCEGDSGGPAYFYPDQQDRVHRLVVGVNLATVPATQSSYLTSLSSNGVNTFLMKWALDNGDHICGLHPEAQDCRPF